VFLCFKIHDHRRQGDLRIFNVSIFYHNYGTSQRRVSEFITDEALLKVGENCGWLWVAIEPIDTIVLGIRISFERKNYACG